MIISRCEEAKGAPPSSREGCRWLRLGLFLCFGWLLMSGEPLTPALAAPAAFGPAAFGPAAFGPAAFGPAASAPAASAPSWRAARGPEPLERVSSSSVGVPPIEVSVPNDCPPPTEAFTPDELKRSSIQVLYAQLEGYCRQRSSAPVGIVRRIRLTPQSSGAGPSAQPSCSRLAIRQFTDPKTLRVNRQPMATGMKLCERDMLVTWQGIELNVQYFRIKKGGVPSYAEKKELFELSRLRLGARQTELVEGKLGQFTDPDYQDIVTVLGQTNRVAARPGTYMELEVTDRCTGQGTITVPEQERGAPGERHEVSVCESVDGELTCKRTPILEGERQAILLGKPGAEQPSELAQGLQESKARYGELKQEARVDQVPLPAKDGDYVAPPRPGELRVEVKPAQAQLWVNGEPVQTREGVFERKLAPGPYVLVALLGSERKEATQALASGQSWKAVLDLSGQLPFGLERVNVPAGELMMGSPDNVGEPDERPRRQVKIPAFQMSKTEVTVAQYRACFDAKGAGCTEPRTGGSCNWKVAGRENHPINCVDWEQAKAYAAWLSGVMGQTVGLPSEAQWEYAARGPESRTYPWGEEAPTPKRADYGNNVKSTTSVGQYPEGASWVGALDMAGNVWEWVEDCYEDNYNDAPKDGSARTVCAGSIRVLRGGSWFYVASFLRGADRLRGRPSGRYSIVGFR
ncbi:MAG: formylglycine-generating enzyme family protein, partial [Myxococcota bacterium]